VRRLRANRFCKEVIHQGQYIAAKRCHQNSATLTGTVSTSGLQTEYGFEIATTPGDYGGGWGWVGTHTGLGSIGGARTEAVSLTLGELLAETGIRAEGE